MDRRSDSGQCSLSGSGGGSVARRVTPQDDTLRSRMGLDFVSIFKSTWLWERLAWLETGDVLRWKCCLSRRNIAVLADKKSTPADAEVLADTEIEFRQAECQGIS